LGALDTDASRSYITTSYNGYVGGAVADDAGAATKEGAYRVLSIASINRYTLSIVPLEDTAIGMLAAPAPEDVSLAWRSSIFL
jgi:hypothetical protein